MARITPGNPAVAIITKSINGRQFSNVWFANYPGAMAPADKVTSMRDVLLPKLVALEKAVALDDFLFDFAYVGDATEQPPAGAVGYSQSLFERVVLSGNGSLANADPNAIAPLMVALLWNLQTDLDRPGFKYWRCRLGDSAINPGGRYGVLITTPGDIATWNTELQAALVSSGVSTHLMGGSNAGTLGCICTAHYQVVVGDNTRNLLYCSEVKALRVARVTERQMHRRGKRRSATDV